MFVKFLSASLVIAYLAHCVLGKGFNVRYEWKYVDYNWVSQEQKQNAIKSGDYNYSAIVLFDVDKSPDGRTFVTAVRDEGVPASLMTVSDKTGPGGPLLDPYPNWSWYSEDDCNRIISVYRVSIKCNHLFVLDCGMVGEIIKCPPKLLIFDLGNDQLERQITIPKNIATNRNGTGLLVTPVVQVYDNHCNEFTVYMADTEGYGLAIYNEGKFMRRNSPNFRYEDNATNFTIAGQSFNLKDGILGMALSANKAYSIGKPSRPSSELFFAPLASYSMYRVPVSDLLSNYKNAHYKRKNIGSQTAAIAMSSQGVLFYSNVPNSSILCQNTNRELTNRSSDTVDQNINTLQFPSGLKVIPKYKTSQEAVMIMTNRYQTVATGTHNPNEINYRILTQTVSNLIQGTNCS